MGDKKGPPKGNGIELRPEKQTARPDGGGRRYLRQREEKAQRCRPGKEYGAFEEPTGVWHSWSLERED